MLERHPPTCLSSDQRPMRRGWRLLGLLALCGGLAVACVPERAAEVWDPWFDEGAPLSVTEPVAYTDVPYDFPAAGEPGIADLPIPNSFQTIFGADDAPPSACRDWSTSSELPVEVEGMVTIHPRFYFKTVGCLGQGAPNNSAAEKYYGSFFIEDATGGMFVLGDSKIAHFDMGDRVRMRVRAVRNRYDLPTVAVHEILEIKRGPDPIYYEQADRAFGPSDLGEVRRVVGTVVTEKDTFGEFQIEGEDGVRWTVGLDVQLNRRGVDFPVGTRVQATGPIIYAYSAYSLVVMRVGQVQVLD